MVHNPSHQYLTCRMDLKEVSEVACLVREEVGVLDFFEQVLAFEIRVLHPQKANGSAEGFQLIE